MLRQFIATLSCNIGAMVTSSGYSWLAPLALSLTSDNSEVKMTLSDFSWITSITAIGFLLFVIPSGVLADRYGRKTILISAAPLSMLAWMLTAFTRNLPVLYIVRFIQGIILAITFTVAPIYVAEVASPKVRGLLGSHFNSLLHVGSLFCYLTGSYLQYQIYIYSLMVIPVVYFIMFISMPETPYYLFMVNKKDKACKSYYWLSERHNTEELLKIEKTVKEDMNHLQGWMDLIADKSDKKALFIVQLVALTRAFTGLPAYTSFGTQLFASSRNNIFRIDQLAITMMVIFCISSFLSAMFSDTAGRRRLMILSSSGTIISNFALFLYFYIEKETTIDISVWFMYVAVIVFCIASNMGIAQLQMVIQAEFFPSHTRGKGSAISGITSALGTFIVIKLYQTFDDLIGVYMNFLFYAISTLICIVLIKIYIPESAGKTLAEVNSLVKEENQEMLTIKV